MESLFQILALVGRFHLQMNFPKWIQSVPKLDDYILVMPQLLGQLQHLLDDFPEDLSLVLQHVAPLAPLMFCVLLYCTYVLLVLGHIHLLFSGHVGFA